MQVNPIYYSSPISAPGVPTKAIEPLRVAIMGTNDLEGKVYPTKLLRPDTK